MRMLLISTLALAAVTSVALADPPQAMDSRSAGLTQLTAKQMDQVTAGSRPANLSCDFAVACVQSNQQNQSGDNIGGSAVVTLVEGGTDEVAPPVVRCARAGACVQNNQQNQSGDNIGRDAVIIILE